LWNCRIWGQRFHDVVLALWQMWWKDAGMRILTRGQRWMKWCPCWKLLTLQRVEVWSLLISLRVVYVFGAIEDLERFFTVEEIDYGGMIYSILENQFVFYFIEGIGKKEDSGWNAYTKTVKAIVNDELCNYLLLCWAIIFVKLIVLSPHCTHFYDIFYVSCTLDSSSMDCSNTNIKVLRGHLMSFELTSDLFWERSAHVQKDTYNKYME